GLDALFEPLHDRGLTDTGFTDEYRVVLGAAAQDLDDPTDLPVPADDRIDLALTGPLGQVHTELLQGLVGVLGVFGGDPPLATYLFESLQQRLGAGADLTQHPGRLTPVGGQTDQQVRGGGVLGLHPLGALRSSVDGHGELTRGTRRTDGGTGGLRQRLDGHLDLVLQVVGAGTD